MEEFALRFLIVFLLLCSIFLVASPAQVFAHQAQADKSLGSMLHIDPDDDPVAGQESVFHFDFSDKAKLFNKAQCMCTVTVLENGSEIFYKELVASEYTAVSLQVAYTFPHKGVYQVRIAGQPKPGYNFQPFSMQWDVRVDKELSPSALPKAEANLLPFSPSAIVAYEIGVLLVVISILILGLGLAKRKK